MARKRSTDPAWRTMEKVVSILEKHISAEVNVSHDVELPVLNSSSGRTRQCDVVIVTGTGARQTTTIVEVQKRKSKPDINTFNGWIGKLEEVGGQHLICVSEAGFPKSVLEKARAIGPKVRLLTLTQLEAEAGRLPPFEIMKVSRLQEVRYEACSVDIEGQSPYCTYSKEHDGELKVGPFDPVFREPGKEPVSASTLVDRELFSGEPLLRSFPEGKNFTLGVIINPPIEFQDAAKTWVALQRLRIRMEMIIMYHPFEWESYRYHQVDYGELGWVLSGKAKTSQSEFEIVCPIIERDLGQYEIKPPVTLTGQDTFLSTPTDTVEIDQFTS